VHGCLLMFVCVRVCSCVCACVYVYMCMCVCVIVYGCSFVSMSFCLCARVCFVSVCVNRMHVLAACMALAFFLQCPSRQQHSQHQQQHQVMQQRKDLKVLVTSATLQSDKFSAFFGSKVSLIPGKVCVCARVCALSRRQGNRHIDTQAHKQSGRADRRTYK